MKVTLLMAMSVNGMIASENGDEDFLSHENWQTFSSLVNEYKNFIVGSRTYEAVKGWHEEYGFSDFIDTTKIVISHDAGYSLDEGFLLAASPESAVKILQQQGFDKVLLAGGATVNSAFAKAGLIDEIILNIEPVIVGRGIPLFSPEDFQLNLELTESKNITDKLIQLRFRVKTQ